MVAIVKVTAENLKIISILERSNVKSSFEFKLRNRNVKFLAD